MNDFVVAPSAPTAPDATSDMISAYLSGDSEKAQQIGNQVNAAAGLANAAPSDDPTKLQPMAPAPTLPSGETDRAIQTLNSMGGEHAQLVQEWGPDFKDNLSFAKSAFADIVANRPDLIAKVDAAGLGNDPAVLQLLAKHGRMNAGMMGTAGIEQLHVTFLGFDHYVFFCARDITFAERGAILSAINGDPILYGSSGYFIDQDFPTSD